MRRRIQVALYTDDILDAEILDFLAESRNKQEALRTLVRAGFNSYSKGLKDAVAVQQALESPLPGFVPAIPVQHAPQQVVPMQSAPVTEKEPAPSVGVETQHNNAQEEKTSMQQSQHPSAEMNEEATKAELIEEFDPRMQDADEIDDELNEFDEEGFDDPLAALQNM
ncbi:hypothetical protein [Neptuniibacter sp. QD37_11]|uniref:hypothetical protein n=1 Tax=Neptuniibacter sp. QD37_11 TaxID=3398209 RepID=UPI0039F4E8A8